MTLIAEHDPLRWLLDGSAPDTKRPDPAAAPAPARVPGAGTAPAAEPAPERALSPEVLSPEVLWRETLSAEVLSAVTGSALAAEERQWLARPGELPQLMVCVYAGTVSGMPQGLYEWADGYRSLPARDLRFADQYGPASAFVLVCGNIRTACESEGTRGYGQALVRAGAVGHHVLREAGRHGVGGRAHAQSCHQMVRALEVAHGDMWRHLFTVALQAAR